MRRVRSKTLKVTSQSYTTVTSKENVNEKHKEDRSKEKLIINQYLGKKRAKIKIKCKETFRLFFTHVYYGSNSCKSKAGATSNFISASVSKPGLA